MKKFEEKPWMQECQQDKFGQFCPLDSRDFLDKYGKSLRTATLAETTGIIPKPIIWIERLRCPFVFKV